MVRPVVFKMEDHNPPPKKTPPPPPLYTRAALPRPATAWRHPARCLYHGARPSRAMNPSAFGEPSHHKPVKTVHGVVAGVGRWVRQLLQASHSGRAKSALTKGLNGNCLVNAVAAGRRCRPRFSTPPPRVGMTCSLPRRSEKQAVTVRRATDASAEFDDTIEGKEHGPTVQVGDPVHNEKTPDGSDA